MPLNVIIGPANSGKKQELFDRFRVAIKVAQESTSAPTPLILVPSAPEASFIRKELLQENPSLIGATVTPYNQFLKRLAQKAGISQAVIDPIQQDFIIRRIVKMTPLAVLSRSSEYTGFNHAIKSFLNELKEGMVTPNALNDAFLKWGQDFRSDAYLNDILVLYRTYLDELAKLDLLDEQMLRWEIATALENGEIEETSPLFLYGFDDFTTSQRRIIDLLSANTEVTFALTYEDTDAFVERKKQVDELLRAAGKNVTHMSGLPPIVTAAAPGSHIPTFSSPISSSQPSPHFLVAAGDRGEIELVGAKILELLRSGRYKPDDMVVILRDPNRFKKTITSVFENYSILFSFGEPIALTQTKLGRALTMLIDLCKTWQHYSKPQTNPYIGQATTVKEPAIKTGEQTENRLTAAQVSQFVSYLRIRYWDKQNLIDRFEREVRLKKISDVESLLTKFQDISKIHVEEIDKMLRANNFADTLSIMRIISASILEGILSVEANEQTEILAFTEIEGALQSLEGLIVIAPDMIPNSTEVLNGIQNTLDNIDIRIGRETESGKVHVLRVHRARGRSYKVAFVVGLNDGFFPKSATDNPFFNLNERTELADLGLELDTRQNSIAEERYLFYIATSRASDELYLSYQSVDSDANKLLKSSFIVDLEADLLLNGIDVTATGRSLADIVFDGDAVPIPSKREALRFASSIYRKKQLRAEEIAKTIGDTETLESAIIYTPSPKPAFNSDRIRDSFTKRDTFSISEIKSFASCPFRWFIEQTLKPQKLDVELDALNKGTIQHAVLEEFYRELPARLGVNYPTKNVLAQAEGLIEEIFESVFEREALDKESIEARFTKHDMLENLKRFIRAEIMRARKQPAGFKPHLLEASFGIKSDVFDDGHKEACLALKNGIKIRGRIDRIDANPKGRAIVLDYKSNSISGVKDIEAGEDLQVPVYMEALTQIWGLNPIAGGYLSIAKRTSDGIYNSDVTDGMYFPSKSGRDNEAFDRIIESAIEKTCAVANELRTGVFAATTDKKPCEYCELTYICRKDRV